MGLWLWNTKDQHGYQKKEFQLFGLEDADPDPVFSSMLGHCITTMLKTLPVPAIGSDY